MSICELIDNNVCWSTYKLCGHKTPNWECVSLDQACVKEKGTNQGGGEGLTPKTKLLESVSAWILGKFITKDSYESLMCFINLMEGEDFYKGMTPQSQ